MQMSLDASVAVNHNSVVKQLPKSKDAFKFSFESVNKNKYSLCE